MSQGTNRLIQNGAYAMISPQDVLDALGLAQVSDFQAARQTLPADTTEAKILQVSDYEPVHVDEICHAAGLPVETVTAALTMMELKGMVQHVGAMRYTAIREINRR
jgi:DNA processing protein